MTFRPDRRAAAGVVAAVSLAAASCGGAGGGGGDSRTGVRPLTPLRVTVAGPGLADTIATAIPVGAGRVATVAHVLDAGGRVEVAGRPARILRRDARLDLAILAVPGLRAAPARLAETGTARHLLVVRDGRPRALAVELRRRAAATVERPGGAGSVRRPALEVAAAVVAGDSGAPVTDAEGRVLGLVFARSTRRPATAWAVAASALRGVLRSGSGSRG